MAIMLDDKDRIILNLLQEDGRATISDIAKRLHLSRTTIRYRIAELERCGLIKGYTVVMDPLSFESTVFVNILIQVKPLNLRECISSLRHYKEVVDIYRIGGEHRLFVTAFFRNPQHQNNFTLTRLEKLPIEDYSLLPVVQVIQKGNISL